MSDNEAQGGPSKVFLYSIMLGMLITGSANTIVQDLQNDEIAYGEKFTHPYFQTAIMFTGELSVFLAYGVKKWWLAREARLHPEKAEMILSPGTQQANQKQLKMNPSPLLLAIPATLDFTGSTLMFIALTMVPPSTYQMMRGFINVVTPILSIVFLKRKQYRHHLVGVICIVIGVAEVGVVTVAYPTGDDDSSGSAVVGIILLLTAQLFTGTMFIVEEYFIGDYYLDPMKVVGLEGMWGLCYYICLLPVMQSIHCTGSTGLSALCNYGYLENSSFAFAQMAENPAIIWYSVAMMASIACFNVCGITTTKIASASQRATIDTSRTLLIWICSCLLGLEVFHWEEIFGFVFLVFGTLLYNEIIVLPFCGFDQYTKEKLEQRDAANKRNAAYASMTSPHAVYDANRNKRLLQKEQDTHYDVAAQKDGDFDIAASDNSLHK